MEYSLTFKTTYYIKSKSFLLKASGSIEKFKGYERRKSKKEQIDEQRKKDNTFESIDLTVPPGSIVS